MPVPNPANQHTCRKCGRKRSPDLSRCAWCGTLARAAPCRAHPRRVAMEACVACGTRLCPRCRRGPRYAALCGHHESVNIISGWAEVYRTAGELDADMVANILLSAGVEAQVLSQKDSANVVSFGGLSVVRVLVPPFQYDEGQRLLEEEGIITGG